LPHWLPADFDGAWPWFGLLPTLIDTATDVLAAVFG